MTDEQNSGASPDDGGDDPTVRSGDGDDSGQLPAESLERGSDASRYEPMPNKPDPTTVAQIEVLPDE